MMSAAKTKWEISVIPAMGKTIIVTVPRNCTTAELYDELKKHPLATVAEQHMLMSNEGELVYSDKNYLEDYDIENNSTIQLMAKVNGGEWPLAGNLEGKPRLKAIEAIQITTSEEYPDVFGFDDNTPRAIMACGHAVAPLSLALHCYHELEKGEESIKCPDPNCDTHWKFSQIRKAAGLSMDESHEFERKALFNRMRKKQEEIKSCPKCSAFCIRCNNRDKRIVCSNCTARSGKQYGFCWTCLSQWNGMRCENPECGDNKSLFDILATCMLKELNGVECPSERACPRCFALVEYVNKCKHRTCSECQYEFCFICLKPYPCKTDVWGSCDVAPRLPPAEIRPITKGGGRWQVTVTVYDGNHIQLNIPANCFVDEFIRTLYYHPKAPKVCGYRVIFGGSQLDNRQGKRLSDYGVQDHSVLHLCIKLTGG